MKTVNLEEILLNTAIKASENDIHSSFNEGEFNIILNAMRIAIEQALELAAENAEVEELNEPPFEEFIVDKQSILDTINQVI